jgi:hypothetical protein
MVIGLGMGGGHRQSHGYSSDRIPSRTRTLPPFVTHSLDQCKEEEVKGGGKEGKAGGASGRQMDVGTLP